MRSLLPRDQNDELLAYLPSFLKIGPVAAILLPPVRIGGSDRRLYPIRMTLAVVGLIVLGGESALFFAIGQRLFSAIALLGALSILGGLLLLRAGKAKLGMGIGWLVVMSYVAAIQIAYGTSVGVLLFAFPIALAGYCVYAPPEWGWRLVPTVFALLAWTVVAGHFAPAPRIALGRFEEAVLLSVHAGGALYAVLILASHTAVFREAAERRISAERDRADRLLLNVLPASIARRLMNEPRTIADHYDEVAVLFADLVGFTALSSRLSGAELVELLNQLFSEFDQLAERHGLEKIKTIGDAYMVVAGLPLPLPDPAVRAARMAADMQRTIRSFAEETGHDLALRIGIHVGPVTAGVIGKQKFAYDLWGDTVNVASRMESSGLPGRIHVSADARERLREHFGFADRRELEIKGKGTMETWFLDPETPSANG